jgi:hypothetical protein
VFSPRVPFCFKPAVSFDYSTAINANARNVSRFYRTGQIFSPQLRPRTFIGRGRGVD